MRILILNGSPRRHGNTAFLTAAFAKGAREAGHDVEEIFVDECHVHGCLGCDYCRRNPEHACIQKDDMQDILEKLSQADLLVLATPVYYFNFSAQLMAVIQRTYSVDIPANIRQTALIWSAGSAFTAGPVLESYFHSIVEYWNVHNAGIWYSHGKENQSEKKAQELYEAGLHLQELN